MVSLVIVMLTMMAIAGSVLTLRHLRRNREVDQLFLQLRIRDGLLTDESLAALPIALTVHLPPAPWSPAVVEITGCVPTPELRDVSVLSGPAVPLPQGANRWRSSPEGGLR